MKDDVVICAIAKNEHLYINDWVKHHLSLGFDHIYLFDNDNILSSFVGNYIDRAFADKITIFNVRGIKLRDLQVKCYNIFYRENHNEFAWCAFIDIDEYIVLRDWSNIHEFLSDRRFNNYSTIRLKWHLYGDDNVIKRDVSIPVINFFKNVITDNAISHQGKAILRGGLDSNRIHILDHFTKIDGGVKDACLPSGEPCFSDYRIEEYYDDSAYVNHYMTKTLDEFLNQKLGRGDAIFDKRMISLDYFWRINSRTIAKIQYINEYFKEKYGIK